MEAPRTFYRSDALPGLALCHHNARLVGPSEVPLPPPERAAEHARPFFAAGPACGFPTPADDYVAAALDLNDLVLKNPPATFFVRASGDSMIGAGIDDGDLCVVDRSLDPQPGDLVVAEVEGAFTLKRFVVRQGRRLLVPENDAYPVLPITKDPAVTFFGVVTFTVKAHRRRG